MSGKSVVLTRKAAMTMGALHGFLKPRLAVDSKLDLLPILARVTSKNFITLKPKLAADVKKAVNGKLAKDASVAGLAELLDALGEEKGGGMDDPLPLETEENAGLPLDKSMDDEMDDEMGGGPDADAHAQIIAFLKDKLSPEDMMAVQQLISGEVADAALDEDKDDDAAKDEDMDDKDKKAKDEPPPFKGKPEVGGGMSKDAVNKAIKLASDEAVKKAVKQAQDTATAIREAERFVRPWVGDLAMAHDSAEAVYATTLKALGKDVKGVHPSAYKIILEGVPLPNGKQQENVHAMDSAETSDFAKRYPEVARIGFA
jgi:hypothetical protein